MANRKSPRSDALPIRLVDPAVGGGWEVTTIEELKAIRDSADRGGNYRTADGRPFSSIRIPELGYYYSNRSKPRSIGTFDVRNKSQAIYQIRALIIAFEEALEYDPVKSNELPPPLWRDNRAYLKDVESLLHELRQLNQHLHELTKGKNTQTTKSVGIVATSTRKFFESYADGLGKGAAALTIGAAGALLYYIGVSKEIIDPIWGHLKGGK